MYPSCESVEYATTRLMSYWTIATSAMKNMVMAPTIVTTESAAGESSKRGDIRATMKMPAVTIVAAWIKAEIGVGPSIESGSHTWSGNCALFPMAPTKRQMQTTDMSDHWTPGMICTVLPARSGAAAKIGA